MMVVHGLQANKQGGNPLLAELAAARRAREAGRGSHQAPAAAKQAAPAARAAPAKAREAQGALNAISLLSYNIWYSQRPLNAPHTLHILRRSLLHVKVCALFSHCTLACQASDQQMCALRVVYGAQV